MDTSSIPYKVHQCSRCTGDTEYHCLSCPSDVCSQCKENHVKDLQTIDHDVVSHRDKINFIPTEEFCVRHPRKVLRKYCESCELPVCYHCRKHRNHSQIDVTTAFDIKRKQQKETFHTIRSDAFFYRPVIMTQVKADFKTCHTELSLYQSEMLTKALKLKKIINKVRKDLYNVFCDFHFNHRCLKQMIEMSRHIVSLQEYELRYVQPAFTFSALQFLSSIKTALPQIHLKLHTNHISMTESLNKDDVMESLSGIQIKERGKRRVEYQNLLKLTPGAEFHQCFKLGYANNCSHISFVTSYRVWVSNTFGNLTLIDTTLDCMDSYGEFLNDDLAFSGSHTLSSEKKLIFIDENLNISKLSKDMKKTSILIWKDSTWKFFCVYCSQSTGDLLVGAYAFTRKGNKKGKISRYNKKGQLIQTIPNDNTKLYRFPSYVTENNNGDVVVSDSLSNAVVVTERGGTHRFSYTGHPSGSGLQPYGICTDALSHILVCDVATDTVQMISRDGQFLSHLLIRPSGIFTPCSLGYDVITHRLWVGSSDNIKVVVYRYITKQDALTDLKTVTVGATADVMESLSEIPTTKTEETKQGNQCLLKLMSPPELLHSYTVTDVDCCYHISLTSGRVWVSDRYNLILTDTTGVPLHRVNDLPKVYYNMSAEECGSHTVNSGNELIYIDINMNVKKLSKDMKRSTIFIKVTWGARCVYSSPSTGNLLVGMCTYDDIRYVAIKGKLTCYNQSGQLTQNIKYDNTGLELYHEPNYITENNNGDVVVSDSGAIVVTDHGGRHRFSYTGHPSGSGLKPRGICTDALSHILVCDVTAETVHMINKDGQFLSHLLTESQEIGVPCSLCYDVNTHCLWVGSKWHNRVHVFRYLDRHDALTDEQACTDMIGRTCPAQHQPEDEDRLDIDSVENSKQKKMDVL